MIYNIEYFDIQAGFVYRVHVLFNTIKCEGGKEVVSTEEGVMFI